MKSIRLIYKTCLGFARKRVSTAINDKGEDLFSKFLNGKETEVLNKQMDEFIEIKEKEGINFNQAASNLFSDRKRDKNFQSTFEFKNLFEGEQYQKLQENFNKNMEGFEKENPQIKDTLKAALKNDIKISDLEKTQSSSNNIEKISKTVIKSTNQNASKIVQIQPSPKISTKKNTKK